MVCGGECEVSSGSDSGSGEGVDIGENEEEGDREEYNDSSMAKMCVICG